MAMSLQTPESIRRLQRKLYLKAKAEPAYRFYLLYDKIYREDILNHAYALARANKGAPGVDGVTFAMVEAEGLEAWLANIRSELIAKTYQPAPVRRVMIPKPGGVGERALGIPTLQDRVVQAAAKLVLEPIFEAELDPSAFGYRPRRSGTDAIREVHQRLCDGYTDVVDADLAKYFDTIPHSPLMRSVARRIVVVGGGPAGLKVAEIAAKRGHKVTVLEREDALGGQVRLAAKQPEHEIIGEVTRYLEAAIADRGVEVRLGVTANPALLRELAAEVIVIATGSEPNLPNQRSDGAAQARALGRQVLPAVPGLEQPFVLSSDQVLSPAL